MKAAWLLPFSQEEKMKQVGTCYVLEVTLSQWKVEHPVGVFHHC
jgi:hypothetical protein